MANKVPKLKFNNGQEFPLFGLGTWKSKPGEVTTAVMDAIACGYRHIDCAHIYENEKEVGEAIRRKIADGTVTRADLYITSKLWNTFHNPAMVEDALRTTLANLGLEQLDLYLIHWPFGFRDGADLWPKDADGKLALSDWDYVDTWRAMEAVHAKGLTKSIGVSNFTRRQIERVLEAGTVVPVTNQVESSPYFNQQRLIDFCASKGITVTAYSPLGSPDRPSAKPDDPRLLDDPVFKAIADRYGKSPAQVVLRYQVQRGLICIPKSVTKARIEQNFDIFDFELSADDMAKLNALDRPKTGRTCGIPPASAHKYYPFDKEDEY